MGLSPGDRVDRYEVIELLGSGGMGEVYRARDPKLARLVALKVLNVAHGPGTDGASRLLREARAAAALSHANVLAVFDVGEVEEPEPLRGLAYIAMELVVGRSLRTYVGDESVPVERRVGWLRDVAQALGAAHQAGIVHRDVKPENVMIRFDGAVKVLDFGIARRTTTPFDAWSSVEGHSLSTAQTGSPVAGPSALASTLASALVGTPLYMAPEQLRAESLDGRADQFAWGVMAYELLTGQSPWPGKGVGPVALFSQILSFDPPPPREVDARVPAAISDAIVRALAKGPESRFGTMEALVQALDAKGGGALDSVARAETAPVPSAETPSATPRRLLRWALPAVAVVGFLALLGTRLTSGKPRPEVAPVVEVPSEMSSNPEATAAYRAGVQAFRDASLGPSLTNLNRAIELDPLFAAAHLRRTLTKMNLMQFGPAELQPARNSRASLSEHDRTLLDALEPWIADQPDFKESERRLEAAALKYPSDPELSYVLAYLISTGQPQNAIKRLDAVLALDPTFAVALLQKGRILLRTGDLSSAFDAYAQCMKVSSGTTSCLGDTATVQTYEGKCEDLIATSRRLIAISPTEPEPYRRLAEGLVGTGEPPDVVRSALEQKFEHQPASARLTSEHATEAALAILTGDFARATRTYDELEKLRTTDYDANYRFWLGYARMLIELETGHNARANELAKLFLRQRTAWSGSVHDYSLPAFAVERAAGGITAAKFDELRDQWLARNADESAYYRWVTAYASATSTPEDARASLAARPENFIVNSLEMTAQRAEQVGLTDFLAGDLDEGIRYLSAASSSCAVLDGAEAMFSTWAALHLGRALETRGDTAGACQAYRRVVLRWGAAPTSGTATKAKERRAALMCAP